MSSPSWGERCARARSSTPPISAAAWPAIARTRASGGSEAVENNSSAAAISPPTAIGQTTSDRMPAAASAAPRGSSPRSPLHAVDRPWTALPARPFPGANSTRAQASRSAGEPPWKTPLPASRLSRTIRACPAHHGPASQRTASDSLSRQRSMAEASREEGSPAAAPGSAAPGSAAPGSAAPENRRQSRAPEPSSLGAARSAARSPAPSLMAAPPGRGTPTRLQPQDGDSRLRHSPEKLLR